jgi:hypothetical protein
MGFQLHPSTPVPPAPSTATDDNFRLWAEQVTRELNSLSQTVYNASEYGLPSDGVTDGTNILKQVVSDMSSNDGGILYLPPTTDGVVLSDTITLPPSVPVHVWGYGTKILSSANTTFQMNHGVDANGPRHSVNGIDFRRVAGSEGAGTAIHIQDTISQSATDCHFKDYDKAVALEINANDRWVEENSFQNLRIRGCNYGFWVSTSGNKQSFARQHFSHINIATVGAASAGTAYGFYIDTDADIYRSEFDNVVVFLSRNTCEGFYCDGKTRNIHGSLHMEGNDATIYNNTGFRFGANASLNMFRVFTDIRGTIENPVIFDSGGAVQYTGLVTNSLADHQAFIRNEATSCTPRSIVDSDLTAVYKEIIGLFPVRLVDVGNTANLTSGATEPDVGDTTYLRLLNASHKSISNFTNPAGGGHPLTVRHGNSNTTILHGSGINLQSGSDATGVTNRFHTFIYDGVTGEWYETARIEP